MFLSGRQWMKHTLCQNRGARFKADFRGFATRKKPFVSQQNHGIRWQIFDVRQLKI
jgi:hypothetical protein